MTSVLEQLLYLGVQDSMQKSAGLRDIGKIPLSTLVGNDINHIKGNINAIKNKGNSVLSDIAQKIHGNNTVKAPEVGNYWKDLLDRRARINGGNGPVAPEAFKNIEKRVPQSNIPEGTNLSNFTKAPNKPTPHTPIYNKADPTRLTTNELIDVINKKRPSSVRTSNELIDIIKKEKPRFY